MRFWPLWLMLLIISLVGCGATAPALPPIAANQPNQILLLNELDGVGANSTITVLAPTIFSQPRHLLAAAIELGDQPNAYQPTLSIPAQTLTITNSYGILRVNGVLKSSAEFEPISVKVVEPTSISLGELNQNLAVYNNQVVRLNGTLLLKDQAALLVEEVGSGGVPTANAAQITVEQIPSQSPIIQQLPNQQGNIRYGQLTIIGMLRGKTLYVFWLEAQP
ncbi:MAG TPA: hypothetical protein DEF47_12045 [Herpetosiphon sp.]|uniref:Lipoprotein n=1 Tax=Herpetosiphon aurantiacus (strain ATCC 23779 / DSM 785 / 114-95) TaxID=316274 RepID=A9AXG7_HERA2|nr:hypothetical protein [Herpetosiphon sp.]ABX06887.1 hypothetical protein Haur_4255 [Herpetosiphon aurantiacus DSM 785]HBW50625.1 hypothetical protein [Herpetosiphon sp.]